MLGCDMHCLPWELERVSQLLASSGHHIGGLGGHHVLRHGCSFVLQLHLLHPPHHRECGRDWLVGILCLMGEEAISCPFSHVIYSGHPRVPGISGA